MDFRQLDLPHWREHFDLLRPAAPEPTPGPPAGVPAALLVVLAAVATGVLLGLGR